MTTPTCSDQGTGLCRARPHKDGKTHTQLPSQMAPGGGCCPPTAQSSPPCPDKPQEPHRQSPRLCPGLPQASLWRPHGAASLRRAVVCQMPALQHWCLALHVWLSPPWLVRQQGSHTGRRPQLSQGGGQSHPNDILSPPTPAISIAIRRDLSLMAWGRAAPLPQLSGALGGLQGCSTPTGSCVSQQDL